MAEKKKKEKKPAVKKPVIKFKKAPGIFKKSVKKAKWEKKYLKKIYLPDDRKFLESISIEKDGFVSVDVSALSGKDMKRLKELGKVIKKNRKGVNFIIIFILLVLVGGGVFFQLYLKNKLVQRLIENQLEKVFLAQVDTRSVNLSIFKGEFSLGYLAIADVQNPMTNLVEFSRVEASLNPAELLQGRVFIEELGFSGIVRGTERSSSGEIIFDTSPQVSSSGGKEKGANVISDVISQISAFAGDFDVEKMIEQQKANLRSFAAIDESRARIDEYAGRWEGRVDEWEGRLGKWESSAQYIGTVDAASFSSIESAGSTITKLQGLYSDAEADINEINTDFTAAGQQLNDASKMMDEISEAVALDYEYIESLVTMPAGDKVDWAASIMEDQLSVPLKKYLSYLERGLEWYGRFKKLSEITEKKSPEKRREGRSLLAPAGAPPGFVLVHAFASGEESDLIYRFDLNNIVSEPDKWEGEASLDIGIDTVATGAAGVVITEDSLSLEVPTAPFDLGDALEGLDVSSFSGLLSVQSDTGWDDEGFSGSINIGAAELALGAVKNDSILFRLINTTIESVKPVTASGVFTYSEANGLGLSLDTDLDEGLGNAASALISEGADEGLKLLKEYLGEQLAGPLEEFESIKDEFEGYVDQVENYQSELDSYRQQADDKIAEIQKSVEDNIRKQAEDLIKDVIPEDVQKQLGGSADTLKKGIGNVLKF